MKNLIQGIVDFRRGLTEERRQLFARLAIEQKPDALFIACSDSRVVPNLFASTNPGDLFVLRNIGNIIPPASCKEQGTGAQAAIEFSLFSLNISNIIICGHSECGAMQALTKGIDSLSSSPYVASWLQNGLESVRKVHEGLILNPALKLHNQISQVNVLQQMAHIATYPFVKERLDQKKLQLHGLWFDIAHADVYCYEESINQFVLIDEEEGQRILCRLG